jgi:hypothetical protein
MSRHYSLLVIVSYFTIPSYTPLWQIIDEEQYGDGYEHGKRGNGTEE